MSDIVRTNSLAIFEYLADIGVTKVFLVPGGGNMFLVDAVGRMKSIQFVVTHHEQAAVIAAEYYSRHTGNLGVALVTTGPGSSNAVTGVAGAWFDSIPVLVIAGQVKRDDYNHGGRLRQKGPQEINMVSMVRSITKFRKTCLDPRTVLEDLHEAVCMAKSGRPGPAVLEIPLDVQSFEVDIAAIIPEPKFSKTLPDLSLVKEWARHIADKLLLSQKPLFLLGHGIKCSGQQNSARQLVEKYLFPASLTWPMTDFLPYDDHLNAGRIGVVAKRYANLIVQRADFILVLGSRLDNIVTAYNSLNFGRNAEIFIVDVDKSELDKMPPKYHGVHTDLADFLPLLRDELSKHNALPRCDDWRNEIGKLKALYGEEELELVEKNTNKISIYELVDSLSEVFKGGETIVTGSSGLAIEVFHTHFRNKKGQKLALTTGLGAMGYGIPALLGTLAASGEKVYLFESDGSMMMNLQELQSIKTLGLNTTIFILNNNGYASIRATQNNYFDGRFVGTGPSSGLEIPSIQKIAECFNFEYVCVSEKFEVNKVLKRAICADRPTICEIILRADEVLFPKCSVIRTSDNKFLSAPLEDMSPLLSRESLEETMGDQMDPISIQLRE